VAERILFLTGHLARARLEKVLQGLVAPPFVWTIFDIGVQVAALMTQTIILRRLPRPVEADKIILPGRCRADLNALAAELGVPVARGPDELVDLPAFLGHGGVKRDLSRYDMRIFSEIVDASAQTIEAIVKRASVMRQAGANVIDLGCLPDTPFPKLEDCVRALKAEGFQVSVDSALPEELERGAKAGADFLLSLTEDTLWIAERYPVTPVLIPKTHRDLDSLWRVTEMAQARDLSFIIDPILDPIHFGFAASLAGYIEARRRFPDAAVMMGTGNLTELTEADSGGVTAMLLGICSELAITNLLIVQVSPHTRRTIEEHDAARRLMFAAREDQALPKGYDAGLLQLHGKKPLVTTAAEIAERAADVRDSNFRIEVAEDGIHIYNRGGHHVAQNAMALFPHLGVETDGSHGFYLGTELLKAEIAYGLGKRFVQDEPLDWGVATDKPVEEDLSKLRDAGHTLRAKLDHKG
jgi:dihydropteroate synthase-like protein